MAKLSEVFGAHIIEPKYTYVDRNELDRKFAHAVSSRKHIVIYGPSKQGKSVLWKKHLKDDEHIVIRCLPAHTVFSIFEEILRKLNSKMIVELKSEIASNAKVGNISGDFKGSEKAISAGNRPENIGLIIRELRKAQKIVVIEDFHYLPEDERRSLAFCLKSFGDEECYFVIVGVWPTQDLLTVYNGDLRGRIQEFKLNWQTDELVALLNKGCEALNFTVSEAFRDALVADCFGHVGLLNRLIEKVCVNEQILETLIGKNVRRLDLKALNQARKDVASEENSRFAPAIQLISEGFRKKAEKQSIYDGLLATCAFVDEQTLQSGLGINDLLAFMKDTDKSVTKSRLEQSLQRLTSLQVEKKIKPPLIYYNSDLKLLQIIEPEFFFFRRYEPHLAIEELEGIMDSYVKYSTSIVAFMKGKTGKAQRAINATAKLNAIAAKRELSESEEPSIE